MSLKHLVDDARFLAADGRYLGALSVLMLAIAGSSKKRFSKKQRSLKDPEKWMGDGEAFELFLGGRIAELINGLPEESDIGTSGINVSFRNKIHTLEYILYKYYRCELVHEAELPKDVGFSPRSEEFSAPGVTLINNGFTVGFSLIDDGIALDTGWIDVFINAVVFAPINGSEFGIEHFRLRAKNGDERSFLKEISDKYDLSDGRMRILKLAVQILTPSRVAESSDLELIGNFQKLVNAGTINSGMITGLTVKGLTDWGGVLQPKGTAVIREVANGLELFRIA